MMSGRVLAMEEGRKQPEENGISNRHFSTTFDPPLTIVNESDLVRMQEQSDARFNPEFIAALRGTRKMRPKCESRMVLRTALKGIGTGEKFWGCSRYPRCRFTMRV
jgi:hypothetical protein